MFVLALRCVHSTHEFVVQNQLHKDPEEKQRAKEKWFEYQKARAFLHGKNADFSDEEVVDHEAPRIARRRERIREEREQIAREVKELDERLARWNREFDAKRAARTNTSNDSATTVPSPPSPSPLPFAMPMNHTEQRVDVEALLSGLRPMMRELSAALANVQYLQWLPVIAALQLIAMLMRLVVMMPWYALSRPSSRPSQIEQAQTALRLLTQAGLSQVTMKKLTALKARFLNLFGAIRLSGKGQNKLQIIKEMRVCARVVVSAAN